MDPIDKLNVLHQSDSSGTPEYSSAPSYGQSPAPIGMGHTPEGPIAPSHGTPGRVLIRRDVFWNNVVRDILMAMATAAASSSGRLQPTVTGAEASTSPLDQMFDGRVGVMTTLGQRIPIADLYPVFSCSSTDPDADRSLAADVQCTIFRIKTPTGESYTLPISQIVGVHSLSDELVNELERQSQIQESVDTERIDRAPFGFAAYTSLARSERNERGPEQPESPKEEPAQE
ncbi:MAG: hypothetical protein KC996_02100 [Phycisphaerales bacterium]|nr:hypothetical protein [Phycisphaerales bacterium]